ncbi:transposase family protein [Nonomuraea sp. NPDC050451]|uniref:transposase family protein n=1 Tax=Nonomuraea sp. NPDC050451 TaxID=3364364 RepID=UPI0037AF63AC
MHIEHGLLITARTRADHALCHRCATSAGRRHGRYRRRLHDLPSSGQPILIELEVRRFFRGNPACDVRTFVEQVPKLSRRHARRTPLLRAALEAIALAVGRTRRRAAGVRAGCGGPPLHADPADPRPAGPRDRSWTWVATTWLCRAGGRDERFEGFRQQWRRIQRRCLSPALMQRSQPDRRGRGHPVVYAGQRHVCWISGRSYGDSSFAMSSSR